MNIYESIEGIREQFTGRFSDFPFHSVLINFSSNSFRALSFACKAD